MIVEVISVGSELVSGERLDTNSQWLSQRLGELGIPVHFHTTVGDDLEENLAAFRVASDRAGLVLITGGLGPTQDDLTREALACVAAQPLVEDAESLAAIEALFARRNRPMAERNRVQALLPQGAAALPNPIGSAPGIWMDWNAASFIALPGVPYEMKRMFDEQVVPRLRARGSLGRVIVHRVINLFGRGESDIESQAFDLTVRGRRPEVGITAHDATISFRVSCEGADEAEALTTMGPTLALVRERFGELVLGEGATDVAEALVAQLDRVGWTLATAESCTGGLIAQRITAIPGVSSCYLGGVVSYANSAKERLLGVERELLEAHGAVSPQVAEAMAAGVRSRLGADISLSVTGVAGPEGGTSEKPVGLVWLGMATAEGVWTRKLELGPEQPRDVIQSRSAKHAMNWARLELLRRS
jgi:nicotinamide-nucleotide amidase